MNLRCIFCQVANILSLELPHMLSNVKSSHEDTFTHFSNDRSWSSHLANDIRHNVQTMDLPTFMKHRSNEYEFPRVYMTRRLTNPTVNSLLQELAPVMASLPVSSHVESEISFWMSSAHTTASPHYDMEHNFFLQVNGTKRFLISSPSHYALFQPFTSLHPSWRQARHRNLTSLEAIQARLSEPEGCEFYPSKNSACGQFDAVCASNENGNGTSVRVVAPGIHEITLHPGHMLYIPPFFFHSVTTLDAYSVSINAWIGSKPLSAYNKLTEQVPVPYAHNADAATRVAAVGGLINLTLLRLGRWFSPQEFARYLELRVANIQFESVSSTGDHGPDSSAQEREGHSCEETHPFSDCSDLKIAYQGTNCNAYDNIL